MDKVKKDFSLETLRGLAIILMVAGHVIGNDATKGLRIADDSFWRYFYMTTAMIRMPLFAAISGYLFGGRPVSFQTYGQMVRGKLIRIILPFLTVATLHYVMQCLVPGTNEHGELLSFWKIYIFPYEHFWFSQAIFLIFLFSGLADAIRGFSSIRKWALLMCVALVLKEVLAGWTFFSINGMGSLLVFFLLGIGIRRFKDDVFDATLVKVAVMVFIVTFITIQVFLLARLDLGIFAWWINRVATIFLGVTVIYLLFLFRRPVKWLAWVGHYAYGIFLLHVFGTAGTRILLKHLGVSSDLMLFVPSLCMGLAVPIVIEVVLERSPFLSLIFLGLKPSRKAT